MSCWKDPNALEKGRSVLIKRWKKKKNTTNKQREREEKKRKEKRER